MILYRLLKTIFTSALVIICFSSAFSQLVEHGLPGFYNYAPKEYKNESQNFSITQDKFGFLYFGNLNRIIRFNNVEWQTVHLIGTPILDVSENGLIYAGGYNKIGVITPYINRMEMKDLALPPSCSPGQINKVIAFNNHVLFLGDNMILDIKDEVVEKVYSSENKILAFKANKKIYVSIEGNGLFTYDPDKRTMQPVAKLILPENRDVIDLFVLDERNILIKCENTSGFYLFDGTTTLPFTTDADAFMEENQYIKGITLSDGSIVVGTEYGGIICVSSTGQYLFSMNKNHGMLDNRITDLFVSKNNKLWVTSYNGITSVNYPSPVDYFGNSYGINGAIKTMIRYNGTMYFGSTQGLYYYTTTNLAKSKKLINNEDYFAKVEGVVAEIQDLIIIDNQLYIITSKGVYKLIREGRARLSIPGEFRKLKVSEVYDDIVFCIGEQGILVLRKELDSLHIVGKVKNFDYEVRTMVHDEKDVFWLGSDNHGLLKLDFRKGDLLNPQIQRFDENNGLPENFTWVDVYRTKAGILFSTQCGVYYNNAGKFIRHPLFETPDSSNVFSFYPIVEQADGKLWYSSTNTKNSERKTGYITYDKDFNPTDHSNELNNLKDRNIESIYCDSNNVVWFGGFDGLIRYEANKMETSTPQALCLIYNTDLPDSINNKLFDRSGKQILTPVLKSSQNHIRFEFTALYYNSYKEISYRTQLVGLQDEWSKWSGESFKEYTYIPPGTYTFKVQARDIFGNTTESHGFTFSVPIPLYMRWWAFVIYFLFLISFIYLILKLNELKHATDKNKLEQTVAERTDELIRQKEQTQKLVQKLLPDRTAEEIQKEGKAQTQAYERVTVLFADIEGFTKIAATTDSEVLFTQLNKIFSSFDNIIEKFEIDKIKTIGDAYMCAGGMRNNDRTTPIEVVMAALKMQEAIQEINETDKCNFRIRIGIHTGSVIAGVVGAQKIEYDIWGDTVNVASRMESNAISGTVNISSSTFDYIKDFFECESRGKTAVKYKGDLDMFTVVKYKQHLSEFSTGKTPNKLFYTKLQALRYVDLENYVMKKLETDLPKNLYYHNSRHTTNVCTRVENIGREEKVTDEELLLLKTAALFHDAGFMISYDNNEPLGANLAEDILPKYRYTPEQIQKIKALILSTKMPPKPKNHLEEIICDADLDYLGRTDFIVVSQNLFRELYERGKVKTIEDWNRFQYKFIIKHEYFTATARKLRESGKKAVIEELKKRI